MTSTDVRYPVPDPKLDPGCGTVLFTQFLLGKHAQANQSWWLAGIWKQMAISPLILWLKRGISPSQEQRLFGVYENINIHRTGVMWNIQLILLKENPAMHANHP